MNRMQRKASIACWVGLQSLLGAGWVHASGPQEAPTASAAPVAAPVAVPGPATATALPPAAAAAPTAAAAAVTAATAAPTAAASAPEPAAAPSVAARLPEADGPTRQALEILLAAVPETADTTGRASVTARRGETLDAVIRRTLGSWPLKESFLRGMFVELNPGAFRPGTERLKPDAQLLVPTVADLRRHLQRALGVPPAPAEVAPPPTAAAASPWMERRKWVRFP